MRLLTSIVLLFVMASSLTAQKTPLSSNDMIRAAYLASNPAQAMKDPATAKSAVSLSISRASSNVRAA